VNSSYLSTPGSKELKKPSVLTSELELATKVSDLVKSLTKLRSGYVDYIQDFTQRIEALEKELSKLQHP